MIWIVLLLSVAIGAGAAWVIPMESKTFKYLLSFSGAFLFATLLTHMLPEIFEHGNWNMGWWIMLGFAIQLLLDHLSEVLNLFLILGILYIFLQRLQFFLLYLDFQVLLNF